MEGQIDEKMATDLRKVFNNTRWEYRHENGLRTVTGYDAKTGDFKLRGSSHCMYNQAVLQAGLDKVNGVKDVNVTTVKKYDLSFKHESSHPKFYGKFNPPKNELLEQVANEVLDEVQKEYVRDWGWSSESENTGGARELLSQGPDQPPFLDLDDDDLELLPENDDPIDDDQWNSFFDRSDVTFVQGVLASHCKNLLDDDKKPAFFDVPQTMTDPAFVTQLAFVDPPDGKTHDLNLNPEYGSNKSANRKEVARQTADYIYAKCASFKRHYLAAMDGLKQPTLQDTTKIIEAAMKDPKDSAAIFTTFNGFEKLEEMLRQKITVNAARRMIWAPGQMEAILGKLLLKNVTLSSFQRFTRGNAHGVKFSKGGLTQMFRAMMENVRDPHAFATYLSENELTEIWDFDEMLKEFGWRDDDLKKWDLMQFQVYMLLNLQYYILSYRWGDTLDLDQATWLYLFTILATIDTTVVSDLGAGPELFVRILASGLFLTASGGSKTHDMMSHAYSFRQTRMARKVWREIKSNDTVTFEEMVLFRRSYNAFKLGTSFAHFSDDFLQCCLRRGLAFGQLVNRTSFFASMFGLEFKVEIRPWESVVGNKACSLMDKFLRSSKVLSLIVPEFLKDTDVQAPMNGITTTFTFLDYASRCKQWYPLTSESYMDGDLDASGNQLVGIKIRGVNFLRFHFFRAVADDIVFIVPIRDHYEMYHKLYYSKVKYTNPAQLLIKLRMYAYYTFKWKKSYDTFKKIHDLIKQRFYPNIKDIEADPLLRKEIPRKLDFSIEEVLADFPDETQVALFYLPGKPKDYDSIVDLREKILSSSYRSMKFVHWDLIRRKDACVDIGGVYPCSDYTKSQMNVVKKREATGTQVVGRTRAKVPPRRRV